MAGTLLPGRISALRPFPDVPAQGSRSAQSPAERLEDGATAQRERLFTFAGAVLLVLVFFNFFMEGIPQTKKLLHPGIILSSAILA